MYYPMHVHTAKGSVGDSILKTKDYIKKAKELGLDRLAITNHGSLADMYDFYFKCKEADITPIIGCEVYITEDRTIKNKEAKHYHLVLLAKDNVGCKNLLKIVSDASIVGKYKRPRTDYAYLKEHAEGLIALSACLGGAIPKLIMEDAPRQEVIDLIQRHKDIFGEDFYLEIQPGRFEEQISVNDSLVELARQTNTPLVLTNDIHYLNEEDWFAHDMHVKIQRKKQHDDPMIYPDKCYYLMSEKEIRKIASETIAEEYINEGIVNATKIAHQCNFNIEVKGLNMPHVDIPKPFTPHDYLELIVIEAINRKSHSINPAQYMDRAFYELDVIQKLGFSEYFLTVKDIVAHANQAGIPVGPGRGSVCGSLVAYLCDITKVDPIKYNLLFERFLSEHRVGSVPDVDLDFCAQHRKEMFDYAIEKHGLEKCALVSTFGIRKAKSALRDVGRIYNIEQSLVDEVSKLIPIAYYDEEGNKSVDLSIEDSLKVVPELRYYKEKYPEWINLSIKLEDLPRTESIHAAGTLIASTPLMDVIPIISKEEDSILATSLNLTDAEKVGMIKYDFLSLATLTVIGSVQKDTGFIFDYDNDELYKDENVWSLIGSRNTTTLFQIGSNTYKQRMHRLRPKTIEELAACLALVRGPCIASKQDEVYMQILEGTREREYIHPFYDNATDKTLGILLYQEQLMQIAVNFGFSLEDGFKLMKAVSKKNIEKIESYKEQFVALGIQNEVPEETIEYIWNLILDAGLYCFNESHAIAYALLCYHSAYLKTYFPMEYMTHSLTNAYVRKEEISETISECFRMGIKFLGLDLNLSDFEFKIENDRIRVGMCAIKGFGKVASEAVIEGRPFTDMEDFCERIVKNKCKKSAAIHGIFAGMFECFGYDRRTAYFKYMEIRNEEPTDLIKLSKDTYNIEWSYKKIEKLLLGAEIMENPSNGLEPFVLDEVPEMFSCKAYILKTKRKKDKNGKEIAFVNFSTGGGDLTAILFNAEDHKKLRGGKYVNVTLKKRDDAYSIVSIEY